jgi:hypothetical protein
VGVYQPRFKSPTSQTNVILSVLEADLGSSSTRPTYAKARALKTPTMEKAEVAVNTGVTVASVIMAVVDVAFLSVRAYIRGRYVSSPQ